jgi:hypothetical protein
MHGVVLVTALEAGISGELDALPNTYHIVRVASSTRVCKVPVLTFDMGVSEPKA